MGYKYIVGSGCSFSDSKIQVDDERRSIDNSWLSKFEISNTINLSRGGCGNEYIRNIIIQQVSDLLEQGVSSDEILVGVQFTGLSRMDMLVSKKETISPNNFKKDFDMKSSIEYDPKCDTSGYICDDDMVWIHTGGSNAFVREYETRGFQEEYFKNHYKYFATNVDFWYRFLNNILMIEWFCKSNNINYFFHTGWNLFYPMEEGWHAYDKHKSYPDLYPEISYLRELVSMDKFIFYESDFLNMTINRAEKKSKYGGMWQYLIEQDEIRDDNHPTLKGQKIWGDYLVNKLIEKKII